MEFRVVQGLLEGRSQREKAFLILIHFEDGIRLLKQSHSESAAAIN